MVSFPFRVNQSFRNYSTHPITIPRSLVDYATVDRSTNGAIAIDVVFPNGKTISGKIYSGEAGYGEYRQIRTVGRVGWPVMIAREGEMVDVLISRERDRVRVVIRSRLRAG